MTFPYSIESVSTDLLMQQPILKCQKDNNQLIMIIYRVNGALARLPEVSALFVQFQEFGLIHRLHC